MVTSAAVSKGKERKNRFKETMKLSSKDQLSSPEKAAPLGPVSAALERMHEEEEKGEKDIKYKASFIGIEQEVVHSSKGDYFEDVVDKILQEEEMNGKE